MVADVADGGVCSLLPWDLLCCTGLKEGGSQDLQILKKACLGNKRKCERETWHRCGSEAKRNLLQCKEKGEKNSGRTASLGEI